MFEECLGSGRQTGQLPKITKPPFVRAVVVFEAMFPHLTVYHPISETTVRDSNLEFVFQSQLQFPKGNPPEAYANISVCISQRVFRAALRVSEYLP